MADVLSIASRSPAPIQSSCNRVRQARLAAKISQLRLAELVGVHRSAVAQWERSGGAHPSMENLARIAIVTGVNLEWLGTGRGQMKYISDLPADQSPVVLLQFAAQDETESRALLGLRRLDFVQALAVVELIESLSRRQTVKLRRSAAYTR